MDKNTLIREMPRFFLVVRLNFTVASFGWTIGTTTTEHTHTQIKNADRKKAQARKTNSGLVCVCVCNVYAHIGQMNLQTTCKMAMCRSQQ